MKNKSIASLLIGALLVVSFSGCMEQAVDNQTIVTKTTVDSGPTVVTEPITADDIAFDDFLSKYKQRRIFSSNGSAIPDRKSYGVPTEIFQNLPVVPEDFLFRVYLIKIGKFFDIGSMSENYWKQPEFDPDFTRMGLRYWKEIKDNDYKKTHWSTAGIRSYPYEQYVAAKPGYMFNVSVIMSSDWSVEAYQGIHIRPTFIRNAVRADGKFQNASIDADKYIQVNVTPNEFLLTPAFPVFTEDWSRMLTFTGRIANETPEGVYILSYEIEKPASMNSEKWFMQYLNLYSEGVQMVKVDKPYLQVFIYVGK